MYDNVNLQREFNAIYPLRERNSTNCKIPIVDCLVIIVKVHPRDCIWNVTGQFVSWGCRNDFSLTREKSDLLAVGLRSARDLRSRRDCTTTHANSRVRLAVDYRRQRRGNEVLNEFRKPESLLRALTY